MRTWRISATLALASLIACSTGLDERPLSSDSANADGVSMTEPGPTAGPNEPPPPSGAPDGGSPSGSGGGGGGSEDAGAGSNDAGAPSPFDQFQRKNLDEINAYRATKNLAPLVLDAQLSDFALDGSKQLSVDHIAHAHFKAASDNGTIWQRGFKGSAGENQGDVNGWPQLAQDPTQNQMLQIAAIQKAMFDEGPGQGPAHGHYMTMMEPKYKRVGVGLLMVGPRLYLTNDYSE
ncbi:MAG: CAP domain-containing protein [Labilithrix sp.]|nr:CAP domain-containing protein [Labilithrix sp.]